MCRVLIVKLFLFKDLSTCLNACKFLRICMKVCRNFSLKTTRTYSNCAVQSIQNRGKSASSKSYPNMVKHAGKRKQRCLGCPRGILQLTCLIPGPGHSSDEFKVINDLINEVRCFRERKQDSVGGERYVKKPFVSGS